VAWLEKYTGFKAFPYEADILRDNALRLWVVGKNCQIGMRIQRNPICDGERTVTDDNGLTG
jgi:hypothetical protein